MIIVLKHIFKADGKMKQREKLMVQDREKITDERGHEKGREGIKGR